MPVERTIRGKRCRVYHEGYMWIWIADTGDFAAHYDAGGKYHGSHRILKDNDGPFIVSKFGQEMRIKRAVMTCFCPPLPADGKAYMIGFRDGNKYNSNYKNLLWEPYHYRHSVIPKVRLYLEGGFVEVYSSGKIVERGQDRSLCDFHYDSDVDSFFARSIPYVRIGDERIDIEDIMNWAGYIQGDDADLKNPRILHKDGDWKNFSSENLEWTEATDPRYQDYIEKREFARDARCRELNKGKIVPSDWYNHEYDYLYESEDS